VEWAQQEGKLLPFSFIERFAFIGDGAEHRVYKDEVEGFAVKATHPNRFGYSTFDEGRWASPADYLTRLAWQNLLFGDDIRVVGIAFEDDQMELITAQPWIDVHPIRPNPFKEEIDRYMEQVGFFRTSHDLDTPLYYQPTLRIIAADAHDRNVLRDSKGRLAAIDLVIGTPGPEIKERIDDFRFGPRLPFNPPL
jgi:hypothetical protein